MFRSLFIVIAGIVLFTLPVMSQSACPPEFNEIPAGNLAMVLPGDANNIRSEPNTASARLGQIPGETTFTVLSGLECDESYVWLQIRYESIEGWTVAYAIASHEAYVAAIVNPDVTPTSRINTDSLGSEISIPITNGLIYGNISLQLPTEWNVTSAVVSEKSAINANNTALPDWQILPAYEAVTFSLNDTQTFTVRVFPAPVYRSYYNGSKVSTEQFGLAGIPLVIQSQSVDFEAEWGRFYRDIRLYAEGIQPPTNTYQYTVSGWSHDERFFVQFFGTAMIEPPTSVRALIPSPLPENASRLELANYSVAVTHSQEAMSTYLSEALDDSFFPSLSQLDTIAASIRVAPETVQNEFEVPEEFLPPPYYGDMPPSEPLYLCDGQVGTMISSGGLAQPNYAFEPIPVFVTPTVAAIAAEVGTDPYMADYAGFDIQPDEVVQFGSTECMSISTGETLLWREVETVDGNSGWVIESKSYADAFFTPFELP